MLAGAKRKKNYLYASPNNFNFCFAFMRYTGAKPEKGIETLPARVTVIF